MMITMRRPDRREINSATVSSFGPMRAEGAQALLVWSFFSHRLFYSERAVCSGTGPAGSTIASITRWQLLRAFGRPLGH